MSKKPVKKVVSKKAVTKKAAVKKKVAAQKIAVPKKTSVPPVSTDRGAVAASYFGATNRGTRLPLDGKIEWIGRNGENPYRVSASRYVPVEKVRESDGQTVAVFLEGGGNTPALRLAIRQGYAKVE